MQPLVAFLTFTPDITILRRLSDTRIGAYASRPHVVPPSFPNRAHVDLTNAAQPSEGPNAEEKPTSEQQRRTVSGCASRGRNNALHNRHIVEGRSVECIGAVPPDQSSSSPRKCPIGG